MAFNQTKNYTNVTVEQNVDVNVNPEFHFGSEFLTPIAQSLSAINDGLVNTYSPLTRSIEGSIQNVNRLAGDIRRTADFSLTPAASPAPSVSLAPVVLIGAGGLAVLLVLLLKR